MTRVFVAIDLPLEIKRKISEINNIISKTEAKLNIVDPDISHITLKFIGETSEKNLEEIKKFLARIKYNKYEINMKDVSFNNIKSPRVVWINGYDTGMSSSLTEIIEDGLAPLGIAKEKRPYRIHTTLARIKTYHPSLKMIIRSISNENIGQFEVSGIKLKKSTLTPQGPVYEDIMEVSF